MEIVQHSMFDYRRIYFIMLKVVVWDNMRQHMEVHSPCIKSYPNLPLSSLYIYWLLKNGFPTSWMMISWWSPISSVNCGNYINILRSSTHIPSGNLTYSYWKWSIYSWFAYSRSWFSSSQTVSLPEGTPPSSTNRGFDHTSYTSQGTEIISRLGSTSRSSGPQLDHTLPRRRRDLRGEFSLVIPSPIGSMYGIYANIGGILMVNVTIYGIHGSYGSGNLR